MRLPRIHSNARPVEIVMAAAGVAGVIVAVVGVLVATAGNGDKAKVLPPSDIQIANVTPEHEEGGETLIVEGTAHAMPKGVRIYVIARPANLSAASTSPIQSGASLVGAVAIRPAHPGPRFVSEAVYPDKTGVWRATIYIVQPHKGVHYTYEAAEARPVIEIHGCSICALARIDRTQVELEQHGSGVAPYVSRPLTP